jgi:uncharacterized membrane protein (UPF0127 family)
MYRARDAASGAVLAERLRAAHTHWTRLRGLLGTRSLPPGEGLWLRPCRQVHMIGMRYAIDVVFLDDAHRVVQTVEALAAGKVSPKVRNATSVLELPAGALRRTGLAVGAHVEIEGAMPAEQKHAATGRRLWFRCFSWTLAFILATSSLVLISRRIIPWEKPCPVYIGFWAAGKLLVSGHSPYDLALLAKTEKEYGWDKATVGLGYYDFVAYHYPPSLLGLILALLVPLGFSTARMTWLVANTELLFITGYILRNAVTGVSPIVAMVLVPIFALSVLSVLVGQVTALILFLMAAAWRLLQRRWDGAAGCVLACLSMKPQVSTFVLMATLVWLGRQRRWRASAAFFVVSALFLVVGTWWVPSWPREIAQGLVQMPLGTRAFPWCGTTWLLVLRSLGLEGALLGVLYATVAVPFCWAVLRCALQRSSTIDEVFASSILATFFVTPTVGVYDLPLLLIPLLILLGRRIPELVGAALLVVLIVAPYIHIVFLVGSRDNMPVLFWFFWIPLLLAGLWFGSQPRRRAPECGVTS